MLQIMHWNMKRRYGMSNIPEDWDPTNVLMFPMKKRLGSIQAQWALVIIEEVLSDIPDEELRGELVVQAHDIVMEFINESDPTMDEVEQFAKSFGEGQPIIWTFDFGNDNDEE